MTHAHLRVDICTVGTCKRGHIRRNGTGRGTARRSDGTEHARGDEINGMDGGAQSDQHITVLHDATSDGGGEGMVEKNKLAGKR